MALLASHDRYPKQSKLQFEFWETGSNSIFDSILVNKNSIQIAIQSKKNVLTLKLAGFNSTKYPFNLKTYISIVASPYTNRQKLLVVDFAHKFIRARVQNFFSDWHLAGSFALCCFCFWHRGRQFADKKFL